MISIGVDVGKKHDPAAIAVLHATGRRPDSHRPAWTCVEIGNLALGTEYQQIAVRSVELGRDFTDAGYPTVVTIDATGIGDAVVEVARGRDPDLHIVAVTIGAGRALTHTAPDDYTVGKHRLTEVLTVALQQSGLTLPDTPGGRLAREQMRHFVAVATPSGYQRHEAAAGHDDLVLALELGVWTGDSLYDQLAGVGP